MKVLTYKDKFTPVLTLFEGIDGIKPVEISLPDPPKWNSDIDNHERGAVGQYFRRTEMPQRFSSMPKKFKKEFIDQEWDRRVNGYWFYNKGKICYMTGTHYLYCNWWYTKFGFPNFRMNDLEKFHFWKLTEKTDWAYGMITMEARQTAKSSSSAIMLADRTLRNFNVLGGVQSKTDDDASVYFADKIIYPIRKLPYFFLPRYDTASALKKSIDFSKVMKRGEKFQDNFIDMDTLKRQIDKGHIENLELGSWMDYRSSEDTAYDGATRLYTYVSDECFSKDTKVRMYDGSVKAIQNIGNGEFVMGSDGTPREVLSITNGVAPMYNIVPKNNGMVWGCNGSHVLSLKWCLNGHALDGKYKKEDTVNISVDDFLKLNATNQQHLMLYRNGYDMDEQAHSVPPYLLGLWLGDGCHTDTSIANIDKEVIEYINQYGKENNLEVSVNQQGVVHRLKCSRKRGVSMYDMDGKHIRSFGSVREGASFFNGERGVLCEKLKNRKAYKGHKWEYDTGEVDNSLLTSFRNLGLLGNKFIPDEYLKDCRRNRLQLLAGLIDSDGYKPKNKNTYEIVQKRESLAFQIQELCIGLGFKASINKKVATMKREGNSLYKCDVFRVKIYGNELHEIPCKVERKKIKQTHCYHKNRRNPMRAGFKIVPVGAGEYFGITVDGDNLFLLNDGTVVHNCGKLPEGTSTLKRWAFVKPALFNKGLNKVFGKAIHTSTVEFMDKSGGKNFREMWYESSPERNTTGLMQYFCPIYKCKSYDRFGYADEEKNKEEWDKEYSKLGVNEKGFFRRQNPRNIADCFAVPAKDDFFGFAIMERVLEEYKHKKIPVKGDFKWTREDEKVYFQPSSVGRWGQSFLFDTPDKSNQQYQLNGVKYPANIKFGIAGADIFGKSLGTQKKTRWHSDGSVLVFRNRDFGIDNPKEVPYEEITEGNRRYLKINHVTNRFCCTYRNRPPTKEEFYEDVLKTCVYYGIQLYPEMNVGEIDKYFIERGYGGYLYYDINRKTRKYEQEAGDRTTEQVKQQIFLEWKTHVYENGMREVHTEIFDELMQIDDDLNKYDMAVAGGYALMGRSKQGGVQEIIKITEGQQWLEEFEY